jgi:hypothetical protein
MTGAGVYSHPADRTGRSAVAEPIGDAGAGAPVVSGAGTDQAGETIRGEKRACGKP